MDTFFARHTVALDADDIWITRLWDERRIAVHYPGNRHGGLPDVDNDSTDPRDHGRAGAQVMRALNALATQGGYVCAQYRGYESCLVGKVAARTPIEPRPPNGGRSMFHVAVQPHCRHFP